ncbi:hypothetical protein MesoLj113a_06770 [Mesorhizobium sp. 113-1-2]|uniref:hypothetical protein n=1 Tax=Mesorhizobium sp. 113-1-2 TaxID=2744515 RepID=UPI00081983C1|nr:hypothetical protein [Mesorhizobium sp. 113-1-2]BAV49228.1 hypothetical protein MLTONO_4325 [Mesorhizobium loti]BCG69519.1 hypothetical protein MesoLj113a_06770 [Mesorhizobium sp. 113-1-2]
MYDHLEFELARARLRVKRAELFLTRANEMLDEERGVGISIALCCRIRSEQRRVADARSRLRHIDPTTH